METLLRTGPHVVPRRQGRERWGIRSTRLPEEGCETGRSTARVPEPHSQGRGFRAGLEPAAVWRVDGMDCSEGEDLSLELSAWFAFRTQ